MNDISCIVKVDYEVYYDGTKDRFTARQTRFYKRNNKYIYKYIGSYKVKEDAYTAINDYKEHRVNKRNKVEDRIPLAVLITSDLEKQVSLEANKQDKFKYQIVEEALKMYFSNKEGYISKAKVISFIRGE